jgi:hypothetical protein
LGARRAPPAAVQIPISTPVGPAIQEPAVQWVPRAETALQLILDEAGEPVPLVAR